MQYVCRDGADTTRRHGRLFLSPPLLIKGQNNVGLVEVHPLAHSGNLQGGFQNRVPRGKSRHALAASGQTHHLLLLVAVAGGRFIICKVLASSPSADILVSISHLDTVACLQKYK